ncbi:MAG: DUF115 domain-containing protein [Sporomusaceae bacterium]|nr:DUF115 domain-containing protein [Sporomusaceae bacterium]
MDNFEQNLQVLASGQYHHIDPLEESDLNISFLAAENGSEFFLRQPGEEVFVVRGEADKDNMPDPLREEIIFVIGFGAPAEMAALLDAANPRSIVVVIEPNLAFFQHALATWDMRAVADRNFIVVAKRPDGVGQAVSKLMTTALILYLRNIRIYSTYYYRTQESDTALAIAKTISERVIYQMRHLGNDFTDAIWGVTHDLANVRHLNGAVDVDKLKGRFHGRPAVVVSAGPSLEKNMRHLPKLAGKALIIAVDTILAKLLKNNIVPDVVCSIERIDEVYEYFYKDKDIPESIALTAPPVLKPLIFAEYKGARIIPYRGPLPVYKWLAAATGVTGDAFIEMGASVAHLGLALAAHAGCSPIILTGQDLAFGAKDGALVSHSGDTIYEDIDKCTETDDYSRPSAEIEGYYGGKVMTSMWWQDVRLWFENQIRENGLKVINATEGGAKINGAEQRPLGELADQYAALPPVDFSRELAAAPKNSVDLPAFVARLREKRDDIEALVKQARKREKKLKALKITPHTTPKNLQRNWRELQSTDELLIDTVKDPFMNQLIHPNIIHIAQKVNALPQRIDAEILAQNRDLQVELCWVVGFAGDELIQVIDDTIADLGAGQENKIG